MFQEKENYWITGHFIFRLSITEADLQYQIEMEYVVHSSDSGTSVESHVTGVCSLLRISVVPLRIASPLPDQLINHLAKGSSQMKM